jgi:RHH-type proline utilization regulon transcriptional repressor/proline dehydrogenase/delta 1-pyrroline-5-carboxylate dehydrogenase
VIVGRYPIATAADVDAAVACARADPDGWRGQSAAQRGAVLRAAAQQIRQRRADLMGIALAEGGRIVRESDAEVSEAVDFCELYARAAEELDRLDTVQATGIGVVVVVPPWNFPIAIPCGGVAAALAAGNTVILKPAPATVVTAYLLAECFWAAGVPKRALQFVFGADESEATRLVTHAGVDGVVFTGGTDTALHLLGLKPTLHLIAETGGKNSTIVTAMADRELAIKHVVHSAFSHAGQKCSATSLLILEREVYESAAFRDALCDAARSLPVGSAWDAATRVAPLICPPSGKLDAALKELDPGESWALMPRRSDANPNLWSPGIKWGVRPGSATHMTELFGPVLGVMCAANLDEAIAIANETGYGLTAGLHSLDVREQKAWAERIRAGNLYINRGTTGAIVLRQPFGGVGKSAIGPGLKAGGPHYVVPLMRFRETGKPPVGGPIADRHVAALLDALAEPTRVGRAALDRLRVAVASYAHAMDEEFSWRHDHFRLIGQDNFRLYRPAGHVRVRVDPLDGWFDVFARACAAKLAGCFVTISAPSASPHVELLHALTEPWAAAIEFVEESDAELAAAIRAGQTDRVRYAARERVPDAVYRAAAAVGSFLATAPVLSEGRIELLWYLWEQSLCIDYHRYGNLGPRAGEPRREPD